jgi:hypothetical protein
VTIVPNTPNVCSRSPDDCLYASASYPHKRRQAWFSAAQAFPIPRQMNIKHLFLLDSRFGRDRFIGLSGTRARQLVAIAVVVLAYKTVECGFVVLWLASRVLVNPVVELRFERINVPARKIDADLAYRPL